MTKKYHDGTNWMVTPRNPIHQNGYKPSNVSRPQIVVSRPNAPKPSSQNSGEKLG